MRHLQRQYKLLLKINYGFDKDQITDLLCDGKKIFYSKRVYMVQFIFPSDSQLALKGLRLLLTQRFLTFRCVWWVKIKDTDDVLPVKDDPQFP